MLFATAYHTDIFFGEREKSLKIGQIQDLSKLGFASTNSRPTLLGCEAGVKNNPEITRVFLKIRSQLTFLEPCKMYSRDTTLKNILERNKYS